MHNQTATRPRSQARKPKNGTDPLDALAKNIATAVRNLGEEAMVIILREDDWQDIAESLAFCLDEEELTDDERSNLGRIHGRLRRKLKEHRRRLTKLHSSPSQN
jgi:dsDNA-specific endonuclease/ATPase MutS2